jgi:hypothetical protein
LFGTIFFTARTVGLNNSGGFAFFGWSRFRWASVLGVVLIQARLADEFGLLNCWQAANPNQPLCQTLRWTGNRTIPYHCDGLFVPKAWRERLESCVVLAGDEWDRLSDHNPVVASFS